MAYKNKSDTVIFIKRTPTEVEFFKGKGWFRIYPVKTMKIKWDEVSINIRKGAFKTKIVNGPIRLFVSINANYEKRMKIPQSYLVNSSISKIKPVPVLFSLPSCSHPCVSHQHASLTPEIASWVPISILAPYTPTQQQWCHLPHATPLLKTL